MDKFLKIQNFNLCKDAFSQWMKDKYNFSIPDDQEFKEQMFSVMKNVKDEYLHNTDMTIKELNDVSLNTLQERIVEKYNLNTDDGNVFGRETSTFGNRPMGAISVHSFLQSQSTNDINQDINQQFDLLVQNRFDPSQEERNKQNKNQIEPIIEKAIPQDEFQKLLENSSKMFLEENIALQKPIIPENPKSFFEAKLDDSVCNGQVYSCDSYQELPNTQKNQATLQQDLMLPIPNRDKGTQEYRTKYITINGFDRDYSVYPTRYAYSIDCSHLFKTYKDIAEIQFNRLIIPNEIIEQRTIVNAPKFVYHHEHKLAYPYLLLRVDELTDVCDGLNQQTQQSFATFIYEDSYKCPNGRGYVIMKPSQHEKKIYSQPLSTLKKLSFSILKPSGALFNTNIDNYNIYQIQYEQYNSLYIKVILDKYFDKNEFYVGDNIIMSNYSIYKPNPLLNDLCTTGNDYSSIMAFVNRPEGHEIIQLGDTNDNGFFRSFYILAPGQMDKVIGKIVVQLSQANALREFSQIVPSLTNGQIINISLQNVISMTIGQNQIQNTF
jgi:hypothetical protein